MEVEAFSSAHVSAQSYIQNLLVDGEDEEDLRLHMAAMCSDESGLRQILREKEVLPWLNHRVRPFLAPPLRLAVNGGSKGCVEALLAAGAEVDLEDIKGQTPLFLATSLGNLEIMKVLCMAGASLEGSRKNTGTPLMIAVRDGFNEGVKVLLENGADTTPLMTSFGCVPAWPLHHSVVYAHFSCFLTLIRWGADPNVHHIVTNPAVFSRLNIPSAVLKYARDKPEFLVLFFESGGRVGVEERKALLDETKSELFCPAHEALAKITSKPLRLKSLCRIRLLSRLRRNYLRSISVIDVPFGLKSFLRFEEFDRHADRTVQNDHKPSGAPKCAAV